MSHFLPKLHCKQMAMAKRDKTSKKNAMQWWQVDSLCLSYNGTCGQNGYYHTLGWKPLLDGILWG